MKAYFLAAALLLIIVFLAVFFVHPALSGVKNGSVQIIAKKEQMRALEFQSKELEDFKKNYPAYASDFGKLATIFVDASNPVDFIEFLEGAARQAGVLIEINVSSLGAEKKSPWQQVPMQVSAKGYFLDVLQFTEKLENGPYLLHIEKIVMQSEDLVLQKQTGGIQANFSISVITK